MPERRAAEFSRSGRRRCRSAAAANCHLCRQQRLSSIRSKPTAAWFRSAQRTLEGKREGGLGHRRRRRFGCSSPARMARCCCSRPTIWRSNKSSRWKRNRSRDLSARRGTASQFAVLFQNRYLWFIDAKTGAARRAPVPAQGQISGVAWTPDRLLIADYANRVVAYDLETMSREQVYRPALTRLEIGILLRRRAAAHDLSQAADAEQHGAIRADGQANDRSGLLSGRPDAAARGPASLAAGARAGWRSSACCLLLACVYIERQEF